MPIAVEFFDLRGYDLVISDTSSFAKGVITSPETLHICYCHTPTRYLWSDTHQYINELNYNKWFKKIISLVLNRLRLWDRLAADRVDLFVANSKTVQKRIAKYYRRESTLIYPPVETTKFNLSNRDFNNEKNLATNYFLIGCRLTPYKRVDVVIEAFKFLGPDYKLKIFGDGVDAERLKRLAEGASNIEFLGRISEESKPKLFAEALAFINPQEEDFGITVVESMAAGRPVIAYRKGGATETVVEGKTGIFFDKQTPEAVAGVIKEFKTENFNSEEIKASAEKFSILSFKNQISEFIKKELDNKNDL